MSGYGIDVNRAMIAAWADEERELAEHFRRRGNLRRRQARNWVWNSVFFCAIGIAFPIIFGAVALGYVLYGVWIYMARGLERQALSHESEYIKWKDIEEVW